MAQPYKLTVRNESTMEGNICVYQELPDVNVPGVLTLAWLSKFAYPGTTVEFTWTVDYNFVWSQQGELKPGVRFTASQTVAGANLTTQNQISFDFLNDAYRFSDLTRNPNSGSLYIMQGPGIPPKGALVGIGMSGHGTFVVPAQPNIEAYFTPHPKYYVVFGDFAQGEVIDITQVTQAPKQVEFNNVFERIIQLNPQNLWVDVT